MICFFKNLIIFKAIKIKNLSKFVKFIDDIFLEKTNNTDLC